MECHYAGVQILVLLRDLKEIVTWPISYGTRISCRNKWSPTLFIVFEKKLELTKSEFACTWVTWLSPPNLWTAPKVWPPRIENWTDGRFQKKVGKHNLEYGTTVISLTNVGRQKFLGWDHPRFIPCELKRNQRPSIFISQIFQIWLKLGSRTVF